MIRIYRTLFCLGEIYLTLIRLTSQFYNHGIPRGRDSVRLRLRQIEHDARNRRVVEKQSSANALQSAAIDFERAQLSGGERAGKIYDDPVRTRNDLGIGSDGISGSLNLDFHGGSAAPH